MTNSKNATENAVKTKPICTLDPEKKERTQKISMALAISD